MQEDDYRGEHRAPDKRDTPMHDLNDAMPDIYGSNAYRLYGMDGIEGAYESISIVQKVKGKKYKPIRIYRAVPDINSDVKKVIKGINSILKFKSKFGFWPSPKRNTDVPYMKVLEDELAEKLKGDGIEYVELGYKEQNDALIEFIDEKFEEAKRNKKKPLRINSGDWVAISKDYAKMHGRDNLNGQYTILTKLVSTSELFTDGNDIREWGYWKS